MRGIQDNGSASKEYRTRTKERVKRRHLTEMMIDSRRWMCSNRVIFKLVLLNKEWGKTVYQAKKCSYPRGG
jgi:hypothetical protein